MVLGKIQFLGVSRGKDARGEHKQKEESNAYGW